MQLLGSPKVLDQSSSSPLIMFNGHSRKNGALRNKTSDLISNSDGVAGGACSNGTVDSMARSS
jgi:hypothetical protein